MTTNTKVDEGLAKADGADIYFERRGSGPALLMIPGGGDGGVFSFVADLLCDEYTVLNFDRRGNSRSALYGPQVRMSLAQQSDDAVAVLRHNGFDSGFVFGSSGGGSVSIEMATRHADAVDGVVAHGAPLPRLMPDPAPYLDLFSKLYRIVETQGGGEGYLQFRALHAELHGFENPPPSPAEIPVHREGPVPVGSDLSLAERLAGNWEFFTTYEMRSFIEYLPDLETIASNDVLFAPAGGADNRDDPHHYGYRTAVLMAERLGVDFVEFPGGHTSYMEWEEPVGFVAALRETLRGFRSGSAT